MKNSIRIKCNLCEGYYVLRKGKYGYFIGCSKFPKCKSSLNFPEFIHKFIKFYGVNVFRWSRDCFKCKKETVIYSYYLYYDLGFLDGDLGDYFRSCFGIGIGDIKSIDDILERDIQSVKTVFSKTTNTLYTANTCIHCDATQGHYFVVEDPHEILYDLIHIHEMDKYFYKKLIPQDLNISIEELHIFRECLKRCVKI